MKLSEKYKIERIIEKIVTENKDKTLNEIKRMARERLRKEEESASLDKGISSKVGIDEIIEVITTQKLLKDNRKDTIIDVKKISKKEREEER